jgi:SAM-dependent methyltransferase
MNMPAKATYLETLSKLYKLSETIEQLEKSHSKEEILEQLAPVREQLRSSALFQRIQDWPRGYAGDYETIEYLINNRISAAPGTFDYHVEKWVLSDCSVSQQHRNKVNHQSRLMLETILRKEGATIASLGCGSCADIRSIKQMISGRSFHFDLIDIDTDAIAFSKQHLTDMLDQCTFIQGNIYKLAKKMTRKYDLIVIGGVFDYLSDKAIVEIIKKLYAENLAPGGKLFYTNLSENDPHRITREYLANWPLIQRSKEDMKRLIAAASIPDTKTQLFMDTTQLTYLVEHLN